MSDAPQYWVFQHWRSGRYSAIPAHDMPPKWKVTGITVPSTDGLLIVCAGPVSQSEVDEYRMKNREAAA